MVFSPARQARDQSVKAFRGHRATPLSGKDMRPGWLLALQTPQSADFIALHGMLAFLYFGW
jgi:hypothetical protein